MNRSIEQALLTLLPTQNSNLPPPLLDLASSLLAQSRHRASTLKAEEEVARLYACAHIACDRVKIILNLPPIEPRPPIKPRLYKRLYSHLDKILPNTTLTTRGKNNGLDTPKSKARRLDSSPASARPLPSRATPTKEASLAQFRTPTKKGTPSKLNQKLYAASEKKKDSESLLPPWMRPTVEHLCTSLRSSPDSGKDLIPTVMAGLQSIVAPCHRRTEDDWINDHLTSLIGAIYWFATDSAMRAPGEETTFDLAHYKVVRKEILALLKSGRETIVPTLPATLKNRRKDADDDEEMTAAWWEGWKTISWQDLDKTIDEVTKRGWLESDWYRSIEYLRKKELEDEGEDDGYDDAGGGDTTAVNVQTRRPDTMLQDKFDFLSEWKRAETKQWKDEMLRRIEQLERDNTDAMEIDS